MMATPESTCFFDDEEVQLRDYSVLKSTDEQAECCKEKSLRDMCNSRSTASPLGHGQSIQSQIHPSNKSLGYKVQLCAMPDLGRIRDLGL